jgi:hypothetical protein
MAGKTGVKDIHGAEKVSLWTDVKRDETHENGRETVFNTLSPGCQFLSSGGINNPFNPGNIPCY